MERKIKQYRNLTVSSVGCERAHGIQSAPMLRIQGLWLADCGFEIGAPVKVKCENGKLIVMLDAERMEAEKKVG